jgi:hypothetical protein
MKMTDLRLGALCLFFILATGCSTMGRAFDRTFCDGFHGVDNIWEAVTLPVCLTVLGVGLAVMMPIAAIRDANDERDRNREQKKQYQELRGRVKAGDLAASEECIFNGECVKGSSEPVFPNVSETRRRAASNLLNAYQNKPEPGLKEQVLLIFSHIEMAAPFKYKFPEGRRAHLEAIVRFGESQALWDYVNDPDFGESGGDRDSRKERLQSRGVSLYTVTRVQKELNETVIALLIMDQDGRAAGEPYKPFVCDLTPYQKAVDLTVVDNGAYRVGISPPCEKAEEEWRRQAINHLWQRVESYDLAAAERCLLDCAKHSFGECGTAYYSVPCKWERLRRLSADRIITAYENKPKLDSHQQAVLEKARALKAEARD